MKMVAKSGREDIAMVYIADMGNGELIEFVESLQPPLPRKEKWVLTISTLYGCPIRCRFCDAGRRFRGRLSKSEILSQIDYLVSKRFLNRRVLVQKFKIQFARMGEPSLNGSVLEVLHALPDIYDAPGLIPSFSTIAPEGTDLFFEKLLEIRKKRYDKRFQFQFSLHTTDERLRGWLIPVRKWSFAKMAEYGEAFYEKGSRKITLNFALADGMTIEPKILLQHFDPDKFLIKVTPVNPTFQAKRYKISSIFPHREGQKIIDGLRAAGYAVILSMGESEENGIGSNCGQLIMAYRKEQQTVEGGYTYELHRL